MNDFYKDRFKVVVSALDKNNDDYYDLCVSGLMARDETALGWIRSSDHLHDTLGECLYAVSPQEKLVAQMMVRANLYCLTELTEWKAKEAGQSAIWNLNRDETPDFLAMARVYSRKYRHALAMQR